MGTIRNRLTIVHHYNFEEIQKIRENAILSFSAFAEAYFPEDYDVANDMISPILRSPVNGEYTFVIMGDCSKLGWEISNETEKFRNKWAKEQSANVQNIIIVDFGEDDCSAFVEEM